VKDTYEKLAARLNEMANDNLSFFHQEFQSMKKSLK